MTNLHTYIFSIGCKTYIELKFKGVATGESGRIPVVRTICIDQKYIEAMSGKLMYYLTK